MEEHVETKQQPWSLLKTGGTIKNCYVQGEIYGSGTQNGGIVSLTQGDVTIENVIANMYMSCGSAVNAANLGWICC